MDYSDPGDRSNTWRKLTATSWLARRRKNVQVFVPNPRRFDVVVGNKQIYPEANVNDSYFP